MKAFVALIIGLVVHFIFLLLDSTAMIYWLFGEPFHKFGVGTIFFGWIFTGLGTGLYVKLFLKKTQWLRVILCSLAIASSIHFACFSVEYLYGILTGN